MAKSMGVPQSCHRAFEDCRRKISTAIWWPGLNKGERRPACQRRSCSSNLAQASIPEHQKTLFPGWHLGTGSFYFSIETFEIMDTISLLESFLHGENDSQNDTSISSTNLAKPLLPKCPPRISISVAQFQFFDNRDKPRKKGQSQYALKIEIYHGGVGQVVFQKPNWYRYVQLIASKSRSGKKLSLWSRL